jgi:acyl transferase domain-containing protein
VVGHSAGEVAAAYAADLLSLEDAVRLLYYRSTEQQKLAGSGRMLVVSMSEAEARALLEKEGLQDAVEIACVNGPQSTVLAASNADIARAEAVVPSGVFRAYVPGNIPFHCRLVDPILPELRRRLAFLDSGIAETKEDPSLHAARIPFVSTVTGRVETRLDADYWCENVRRPVLFQRAIEAFYRGVASGPDLFLEVS